MSDATLVSILKLKTAPHRYWTMNQTDAGKFKSAATTNYSYKSHYLPQLELKSTPNVASWSMYSARDPAVDSSKPYALPYSFAHTCWARH